MKGNTTVIRFPVCAGIDHFRLPEGTAARVAMIAGYSVDNRTTPMVKRITYTTLNDEKFRLMPLTSSNFVKPMARSWPMR